MTTFFTGRKGTFILALLGGIIVGIYCAPFILTWSAIGMVRFPLRLDWDIYFYLILLHLKSAVPGSLINPWYGMQVPTGVFRHENFGLALGMLGFVGSLFGENVGQSIMVWQLIWTALIFISGVWVLRSIMPTSPISLLAMGLCAILLTNMESAGPTLAAWIRLPSLGGFATLDLPYNRTLYPQTAVPLLLVFVGLQIRALGSRTWYPWLAMAAVQFVEFTIFPYATVLMAGTSGVALVSALLSREISLSLRPLAGFVLLSALTDGLFLFANTASSLSGISAIDVDLSRLPHLFGNILVVMLLCTVLVAKVGNLVSAQAKWTIVGLGLTSLALSFGDVVFSPLLLVSQHAGYYLAHTVYVLVLVFLAYVLYAVRPKLARYLFALATPILLLNGMFTAYGIFAANITFNRSQSELAQIVQSLDLTNDDLVITSAARVDDSATWMPLVTQARVLYCQIGESGLPMTEQTKVSYDRKSIYLYFLGRDAAWVDRVLSDSHDTSDHMFLAPYFWSLELVQEPNNSSTLRTIRDELVPRLEALTQGDDTVRAFLRSYRQILVINPVGRPLFDKNKIGQYIKIVREEQTGSFDLIWGQPL